MKKLIEEVKKRIIDGGEITYEEALKFMGISEKDEEMLKFLFDAANIIREKFVGNKADLCTIMNAKSGRCSENCKYCAQSAHHKTGVEEYDLLDYDKILKRALEMERDGAHRFSLVTSGRGIDEQDFEKLLNIYKRLSMDTNLKICASHGIISYEQAVRLKEAGVCMYHHNVETSERFYESICSTHNYQDRIDTIKNVKKAGLDLCCGGIIGLGENIEDRVKMAFEIKGLGIKSIPINILNPIKGTPLENQEKVSALEALKTMAVYRLIIPDGYIRYAGGRIALGEMQNIGFKAGVNAALVGNYLTTIGNKIVEDVKMIKGEGFEV
ncbi:biotin synthase BioB [Crassaminicella thermophila]|uniref:Biotin synthase n=1 Tax=Crassaminicella thermophila TaxID=2599308 RepID=A0A5C0SC06_CRATE|nr:biotin synthase BioB [Crassaminicella thermophila]QEK11038.1 biotin synthase BioB [Crassaminicella thermophila]